MPPRPSFAGRAALAVAFFIGFYVFAIGVAALLAWIPYAEWHYFNRLDLRIAGAALMGAGAILFGIMPRRDKFPPPGPRLEPQDEPALFAELTRIAAELQQRMPAEVYLIPEANAWVAQRGGVLGFGSRRVMGLGYPLMQSLSVSEMRGVLAHEFGHYHGGDTAIGPWLYATRAAIGRTLAALSGRELLSKLFEWYGLTFLRITQAISRQQELTADALAARLAGAHALVGGLKKIVAQGGAFAPFWYSEVAPAIAHGYRPSLADGFRRFLGAPQVAAGTSQLVEQALAQREVDRYDSHPPLGERIAALERLGTPVVREDQRPALVLLADVDAAERRLIEFLVPPMARRPLQPVGWDDMGETVWLPLWRGEADKHREALRGVRPITFPELAAKPHPIVGKLGLLKGINVTDEHWRAATGIIGAALATALHGRGWTLNAPPGEPVVFERDGLRLAPFNALLELRSGELAPAAWRDQCTAAGISSIDLGGDASTPPSPSPLDPGRERPRTRSA